MKRFYIALDELYGELQTALPTFNSNPCGECYSCCKATVMGKHNVTPLELAYLESKVGKEKTDRFRLYVRHAKNEEGELLYPVCPNYDDGGCTVHPYRPYSCRLYGHFRTDAETLVSHCVFGDTVKVIPARSARKEYPIHEALSDLAVDFTLHNQPPEEQVKISYQNEDQFESEYERASYYATQERYAEAAAVLEKMPESAHGHLYHNLLGMCYSGLQRHQEAALQYAHVVDLMPENAQAFLDLGGALLFAGKVEQAREALQEALQLQPSRSLIWGLLGMSYTLQERYAEALPYFQGAVESETDPSNFRLELARCCRRVGREAEARKWYEAALENEFTADAARAEID